MIPVGPPLPAETALKLRRDGFAVVPGPVPEAQLPRLADAYDKAMMEADPEDLRIGSTTTRVHDFVNRDPRFDCLYIYPPVLAACCEIIQRPFKLSSMLGRTLRPQTPASELHVDAPKDDDGGFPLVGFIFMVDEFRAENGATLFLPGSQGFQDVTPTASLTAACGPAGSMIIFNGSVWHGHGANRTDSPRRSIQGAYIRREAASWIDQRTRIRPETASRIGPLAKYLLTLEDDPAPVAYGPTGI